MEAEGDPDEFNKAMTPAKKAKMATELSKSAGSALDPADLTIRAVASTSPVGFAPMQKGAVNLVGAQGWTSASAEIKYMTILTIIKVQPGQKAMGDAFKAAVSDMPVADLSSLVGAKVTTAPKTSDLPMNEVFEREAKKRSGDAEKALKEAEQALKVVIKAEDDQNKKEVKAKVEKEKAEEKKKVDDAAAEMEEAAKTVKEQVKVADKLQKEVVAAKKEDERKDEEPRAGEKLVGPVLVNSLPIQEGEPCRVFLQSDFEGPCHEQRSFTSKVGCAEGLECGPVRDIGAVSYYKAGGAVTTDISGSVVFCSVIGAPKFLPP